MTELGTGDLITLFLFYGIMGTGFIFRFFYPFAEKNATRRYRVGMWRWRKIEERSTAAAEGRVREDKWEPETRKHKMERLG